MQIAFEGVHAALPSSALHRICRHRLRLRSAAAAAEHAFKSLAISHIGFFHTILGVCLVAVALCTSIDFCLMMSSCLQNPCLLLHIEVTLSLIIASMKRPVNHSVVKKFRNVSIFKGKK